MRSTRAAHTAASWWLRASRVWRQPVVTAGGPLFLVASTIRTGAAPLSYTSSRSVYSAAERLEQTVEGLRSVRLRVPSATVALLENSDIPAAWERRLLGECDWLLRSDRHPLGRLLRDGPFKGGAEAFQLAAALTTVPVPADERIFKLSGRYSLTEDFELERFPRSGFCVNAFGGVTSTVLYSVGADVRGLYLEHLRRTVRETGRGTQLENLLFAGVPAGSLHEVDVLGVTGLVAVDGTVFER